MCKWKQKDKPLTWKIIYFGQRYHTTILCTILFFFFSEDEIDEVQDEVMDTSWNVCNFIQLREGRTWPQSHDSFEMWRIGQISVQYSKKLQHLSLEGSVFIVSFYIMSTCNILFVFHGNDHMNNQITSLRLLMDNRFELCIFFYSQ